MRSETVKSTLLGAVLALFMLMSTEGVARVAYTLWTDLHAHHDPWFIYSPDLGWNRRPGFSGSVGGFVRTFDSAGFFAVDSEDVADAQRKILFLGDSNTFGYGTATPDSFPEGVERLVPDIGSINLGVAGASSYQGRVGLSQYLPKLQPALVIFSYNFNDRRYVLEPSEADGPEAFERTWRASTSPASLASRFFEICYLCRSLRRVMRSVGLVSNEKAVLRDVSRLVPRVDEAAYRSNLVAVVQQSRAAGVPIVFILLRDNPAQTEYLNAGVDLLEQGHTEEAISKLETAVELNNMFSDLARLYLSRAYRAEGRESDARSILMTQVEHDMTGGRPVRLDRDYNRIMKEVASEYRVPIVDGASVLDAHPEDFVDFCHFNASGHQRVAELVAAEIAKAL